MNDRADSATVVATDVELHWKRGGEPLFFTLDERRGDDMVVDEDGKRRYQLKLSATVTELYLVDWSDVRYARFTTRPAEAPEQPVRVERGVSVTGQVPV